MEAYLILIGVWISIHVLQSMYEGRTTFNFRVTSAVLMGLALFFLMALKHPSVGIDTGQYLFRYNHVIYPLDFSIFSREEWLYHGIASVIKQIGVSEQGYLSIYALVISSTLVWFINKYSKQIFLSFYLYLTIGLFTLSMSGMRQMSAICLILFAFDAMVNRRWIRYLLLVAAASLLHTSAIVFLPVYFLKGIKLSRRSAVMYLAATVALFFFRRYAIRIMELLTPERYLLRYQLLSSENAVNPLLILTAIAIPFVCIVFWKDIEWGKGDSLMSIFLVMSLLNVVFSILSLNSGMIGRLSFYFAPFNMLLIPGVIAGMKDRMKRIIAVFACLILPMIQFLISTPGGTLQIDNYLFFWN